AGVAGQPPEPGAAAGAGADLGARAAAGVRPYPGGQGAVPAAVLSDPDHEQGGREPLHGRPLSGPSGAPPSSGPSPNLPRITRAEIIERAKTWVAAKVPYSMGAYWSDGYRQDCSGYVSMAWNLAGNEWTGSLAQYATRITRAELQPGDMLLFHNPANPTTGSHVTIFGGWADSARTSYTAYEQVKPHARKRTTPMAYWNNSDRYIAYRYNGLSAAPAPGGVAADAYPGAAAFGPGASGRHITRLGELLVARGGKRFYTQGPGPSWGEADRRATEAFQLAQGWRGGDADGLPGPETWRLLVTGTGRSIPPAGAAGPGGTSAVPAYPGRDHFRPGRSSTYVTQLGRQLVKRGYGRYYTSGPGPRWGEADRRNVEAFQRAQGWRGSAADGYPGPETWRRLFAGGTG
ncbi:peptidoglycan-binding protein, partial [Streptomyces sp. NPDC055078]